MLTINSLATDVESYLTPQQVNQVRRAYYYAEQAHDGQTRRSGDPYITHPLAVAEILAEMHMDYHSLMAAMLHDVIEDTGIDKKAVADQFGITVADLVDGVSKLSHINVRDHTLAQANNFQKMALAMARDIRVIVIKMADRLHNMRTLTVLRSEKRRRIAKETLEIYVPIANRLGMHYIRVELEELGFLTMHPMRYRMIKQSVSQVLGNRKHLLEELKKKIILRLKESNLKTTVTGREKHLYSIYRKMKSQRKSFSEIMDVFAFRILVNTVDECYRALGLVHSTYKPIPGRFKDYIAIPKANGYQSLHTTLFGQEGVPVEIQIRTKEMDDMANGGIAAHWLYKSNTEALSGSHARARQWLNGVLELERNAGNSLEFIENLKTDLFPDEVYVFTPKGQILELPKGATPVDFAFAVHTYLGELCVACRVNKRLTSLNQTLQSGQTIEIITAPDATPSASWLNFVVTGKAKSNIRHILKNKQRNDYISLGKQLLQSMLLKHKTTIDNIDKNKIQETLKKYHIESLDDLLADIGLGRRTSFVVAKMLLPHKQEDNKLHNTTQTVEMPLSISGTEGIVVLFAHCCCPVPGDAIIGCLNREKGLIIHEATCGIIASKKISQGEILEVIWDKQVTGEFLVHLHIELENRKNTIASIVTSITDTESSIEKMSTEEKNTEYCKVNLSINVKDRIHLAHIIKKIRNIKGVMCINRERRKC